MESALTYMFDGGWVADYPGDVIEAARGHSQAVLCLEPQKIIDEFDRTLRAAKSVGETAEAVAKLRLTANTHLAGWNGSAANAYKEQMTKMEIFCDGQQSDLLQALQGLSTAFVLAIAARRSYHGLCVATEAAAINEIGEQAKRDAKFTIDILGDLAKGVLSADPRRLLSGALETMIDVGTHVYEYVMGGDADEVIGTYQRQATALLDGFQDGLLTIRDHLRRQTESVAGTEVALYEPLPLSCDVDSPDFRYETFKLAGQDEAAVGTISPRVAAERDRQAQEEHDQDSPIGRRLAGDKGAI